MGLGLLKIELLVCALMGVIFVVDLFAKQKAVLRSIAIAGSFGILAFSLLAPAPVGTAFFGSFVSDGMSGFFKVLFLLNAFLSIILSFKFLDESPRYTGEYFLLLLAATLGMLLLASSQELITLYVSLELLSISSYILSAHQKDNPRSIEAGIKYLLLGAMASGILLFGISLVYGMTGTTHFSAIAAQLAGGTASPLLYGGIVLILAAMSFKIAVVPFHMWVPDVYEGAPTPVVAFFSVGTKIAGFAMLIRLFLTAFGGLKGEWGILMAVVSALTMLAGNLLAIPQTNIKRFLGYSSIAQAGFVLIGVAVASSMGLSAALFYMAAYLFSNLAAFAVIIIFSGAGEGDEIDDYRGLARRSPGLALALLIALMSLGGVPPLVGFFGKLYLFAGAVESGYIWLAAIGVLMSVVSIYYYLMVLKRVYIEPARSVAAIPLSFWEKLALGICVAGTVGFGFFPLPIFNSIFSSTHLFLK
ncbi:MAG: NADH-quinone oxidoreductase subunit N [Endomicrobiales bacterium]